MLGRKTFTQEELDRARSAIADQLAAYDRLAGAVADPAALAGFEPPFIENLVLALDRPFVHRLRGVTGKDGTALNELEMLVDSLLDNGGVLRAINVIRYVPEDSVLGFAVGDRIVLGAADFARLAEAVFVELDAKYVRAARGAA